MKHCLPAVIFTAATLAPAAFAQDAGGQTSFYAHSYFAFDLARVNTSLKSGGQDFQFNNLNVA